MCLLNSKRKIKVNCEYFGLLILCGVGWRRVVWQDMSEARISDLGKRLKVLFNVRLFYAQFSIILKVKNVHKVFPWIEVKVSHMKGKVHVDAIT